jgi:hypothetical protein
MDQDIQTAGSLRGQQDLNSGIVESSDGSAQSELRIIILKCGWILREQRVHHSAVLPPNCIS